MNGAVKAGKCIAGQWCVDIGGNFYLALENATRSAALRRRQPGDAHQWLAVAAEDDVFNSGLIRFRQQDTRPAENDEAAGSQRLRVEFGAFSGSATAAPS